MIRVELQAAPKTLNSFCILLLTLQDPTLLAPLLCFSLCNQVLRSATNKRRSP
jgi:hypothetical protein